jgi:tRNA(Ile)-lysidine synthetase-like protein
LVLRSWRPGDRFCLEAGAAPRKLSDLLQSAQVAIWDRARWPVLASASREGALEARILWARGFGVSSEFRPSGNIGQVMRVFEFDEGGRSWTGPGSWETISARL